MPDGGRGGIVRNGLGQQSKSGLYPSVIIPTETGLAEHNPDKKIPYLAFHTDGSQPIRQFITAICLNPAFTPTFTVEENPDFLHLRIAAHDATEDLYLSRRAIEPPGPVSITAGEFT